MNNDIYKAAFVDELQKIAKDPVSISKSFLAGFDPTGTSTFGLSQRAKRHKTHLISGSVGGIIGGATIIPSAVSGTVGGIRRFAQTPGGFRRKVVGAIRGFGAGAISPYKQLYHGAKGTQALTKSLKTGKITQQGATHIHKAIGLKRGGQVIKNKAFFNMLPRLKGNAGISELRDLVKKQTINTGAAIGASAGLGAGSSILQYLQGKKIGDERRSGWRALRR